MKAMRRNIQIRLLFGGFSFSEDGHQGVQADGFGISFEFFKKTFLNIYLLRKIGKKLLLSQQ